MIPSAEKSGQFGVSVFFVFSNSPPPPSKKSSTVLNYSRTVDCIAVICQRPKRTSLFLCVKTDEAGKEDGKL